ncbi:MAG: hypothetical protein WB723_05975 [Candidatus Acidiferrales bacterium]
MHPVAIVVLSALAWIVASYAALRPFGRREITDRLPFVLTISNLALQLTLIISPKAFPGLFDRLLGHSIYEKRFETDWQWINRWEIGVDRVFRWLLILGAVWSVINLIRQRSIALNAAALVGALLLLYMETHLGF